MTNDFEEIVEREKKRIFSELKRGMFVTYEYALRTNPADRVAALLLSRLDLGRREATIYSIRDNSTKVVLNKRFMPKPSSNYGGTAPDEIILGDIKQGVLEYAIYFPKNMFGRIREAREGLSKSERERHRVEL